MTEPKHTPGPWTRGGVKELSPTGRCREIVAEDGRIGLVYGTTDEDCQANSFLIAAAPELLDALRELHDFSMTMSNRTHRERSEAAFKNAAALLNRLGG